MARTTVEDFDLPLTVESGQLFTYQKIGSNEYLIQDGKEQFRVHQIANKLFFDNVSEQYIRNFFDLDTNIADIHNTLQQHPQLAPHVEQLKGLRLIRQQPRQAILTFILSSNNNQKRIKKMVEHLQEHHPHSFHKHGKIQHHLLKKANFGYRTPYIMKADTLVTPAFLKKLEKHNPEARRALLQTIPGVGPKVADCILTYSTLRSNAEFPADVWVKRAIQTWFDFNKPLTDKNIQEFAQQTFGDNAAYAQQYLFLAAQQQLTAR